MSEFLDKVEKTGFEKGVAQGIALGIDQGDAQGEDRTWVRALNTLLMNKEMNLSVYQAMGLIGVPKDKWGYYANYFSGKYR